MSKPFSWSPFQSRALAAGVRTLGRVEGIYFLLWNTNVKLLSPPSLHIPPHPFFLSFTIFPALFPPFYHLICLSLSNLPSELILLSARKALHAHTGSNTPANTPALGSGLLPPPPSNLLSFTYSPSQSYFSIVAFVPFISSETKDSCAHGTEGRRGLHGPDGAEEITTLTVDCLLG